MTNYVYDLTPFTMLDYPERAACIVWLSGCNMRCKFCHNKDMIQSKGRYEWKEIKEFLESRKGLLSGVVFSGGEATTCPLLLDYILDTKAMGFKVKVDTNCTNLKRIKDILPWVDMLAIDYKAPRYKYKEVTGTNLYDRFSECLDYVIKYATCELYLRTTVDPNLLSTEDILMIRDDLTLRGYKGDLHIQKARDKDGIEINKK